MAQSKLDKQEAAIQRLTVRIGDYLAGGQRPPYALTSEYNTLKSILAKAGRTHEGKIL